MKKQMHTPEPWKPEEGPITINGKKWTLIEHPHDYARARACVNACTGMEDPVSEIARLRKLAEAVRGLNEDSREIGAGMMAHLKELAG